MESGFTKRQIQRSFEKFHDYVSSVYRSDNVCFTSNFDILINFLETDDVMKIISTQLRENDVSYEDWVTNLKMWPNGQKIFRLPPDDETKRTALLYKICMKMYKQDINTVLDFSLPFDSSLRGLDGCVQFFNNNILHPLIDSIHYKIEDISELIDENYKETMVIPVNVFYVFQDNSVSLGNKNVFGQDTVIGGGANLEK
ncbi:MAG: hypothetical protein WC367_06295 [Methanoregula sp.]|jgi:hypothetical protein